MITRSKILFFTCIMFTVLAIVPQTIADVKEEQTVAEKLIDAAGPEDTAFDAEGRIYISTADGIMRLQPDGSKQEVFAKTPTHPLGLHFDANGNLIVCDGELYSVAPDGTVTMLTNKVDDSPIILANGLDIAADGTIYFADSCFHFTRDEVGKEFENPGPHGRLLAYEPATGATRLVLGDLWFANGVAVSPDQSFVLVAEALGNRVMRYWLTGNKQGQSEVFVEKVMGVDNLDANPRGMFWVPSSAEGIMLEVDRDGNIIRKLSILHPSGEPYLSLAGAREHEGKLYLNSYDYIAFESVKPSSIMKIWKIALLIDDMKAAEKLYVDVLGMKIIERFPAGGADEILFLDAGNVALELIPKSVFAREERLGITGVHHLSFRVDNIEKATEELKAKGVEFVREPFVASPGLRLAFFDGLDGVNLQLFEQEK